MTVYPQTPARIEPDAELVPAKRFDWERILRRCQINSGAQHLALILATYANGDGTRIRPGRNRLANVTGTSPRSITRNLAELRKLGLIERIFNASQNGSPTMCDEYRLTIPSDIIDRIPMLDPDEQPGDTHAPNP